jgi:hypothetical protein
MLFIRNAIQYIGVIGYGVKPFDTSNVYANNPSLEIDRYCRHYHKLAFCQVNLCLYS